MSALLGRIIDQGKVPDQVLRLFLRGICMFQDFKMRKGLTAQTYLEHFAQAPLMSKDIEADSAHEVPVEFFERFLGKRLFSAGAYWPTGILSIDEAEEQMLDLICKHAKLQDGMDILELGCQWGALTLWIAERYPRSVVIAIAENKTQRDFVEAQARLKGLKNIQAFCYDLNDFNVSTEFDRIISIELFNRAENFQLLAERLVGWLKPEGKLFLQLVTHAEHGSDKKFLTSLSWLHTEFLRGRCFPPRDIFAFLGQFVSLEQDWVLSGRHYQKSTGSWHARLERQGMQALPILARAYGQEQAEVWYRRWKFYLNFLTELFATRDGQAWQILQYLLSRLPK